MNDNSQTSNNLVTGQPTPPKNLRFWLSLSTAFLSIIVLEDTVIQYLRHPSARFSESHDSIFAMFVLTMPFIYLVMVLRYYQRVRRMLLSGSDTHMILRTVTDDGLLVLGYTFITIMLFFC